MKKVTNQISICIIAVSITFLHSDMRFMVHSDFFALCYEISDINNTIEISHSHECEDHFFCNDFKTRSIRPLCQFDFILASDINPKTDYVARILRPPQIS